MGPTWNVIDNRGPQSLNYGPHVNFDSLALNLKLWDAESSLGALKILYLWFYDAIGATGSQKNFMLLKGAPRSDGRGPCNALISSPTNAETTKCSKGCGISQLSMLQNSHAMSKHLVCSPCSVDTPIRVDMHGFTMRVHMLWWCVRTTHFSVFGSNESKVCSVDTVLC